MYVHVRARAFRARMLHLSSATASLHGPVDAPWRTGSYVDMCTSDDWLAVPAAVQQVVNRREHKVAPKQVYDSFSLCFVCLSASIALVQRCRPLSYTVRHLTANESCSHSSL